MKKCIRVISSAVVLMIFGGLSGAYALPGGYDDNGKNYIEGSSDLSRWSCGLYADGREREADIDGIPLELETSKVMGYIGYDLTRWLTLYGTAGSSKYTTSESTADSSAPEYGIGLKANLLDHEIMDPTLLEDQLRLNLGLQYAVSSLEWMGQDEDVDELSASLILGLVNDVEGNALFLPNGIGLFAGAIFSSYMSGPIDERKQFGATVGLEVYCTERVTLEVRIEDFNGTKLSGGIHLRL